MTENNLRKSFSVESPWNFVPANCTMLVRFPVRSVVFCVGGQKRLRDLEDFRSSLRMHQFRLQGRSGTQKLLFGSSQRVFKHTLMKTRTQAASVVFINHEETATQPASF